MTVITKDILPNASLNLVGVPHITKRNVDKWLDHEQVRKARTRMEAGGSDRGGFKGRGAPTSFGSIRISDRIWDLLA